MEHRTASHHVTRVTSGGAQAPQVDYAGACPNRAEHLFEVPSVAWVDAEASARFNISVPRLHHDARRGEPGSHCLGQTHSVIEDHVLAGSRRCGSGWLIRLFPSQFVDPVGWAGDIARGFVPMTFP